MGLSQSEAGLIAIIIYCFFLICFAIILKVLKFIPSLTELLDRYSRAGCWDEKVMISLVILFRGSISSIMIASISAGFAAIGAIFGNNNISIRGILRDFYNFLAHIAGKPGLQW